MLKALAGRRTKGRPEKPRVGLALAGGGPLGGIYEIGALLALNDALDGIDLNALDVYVGVSSGSLIAASLVNGISPAQLYRIYIENVSDEQPITPDIFQRPAFGEYYRRASAIPALLARALWRYLQDPWERGLWGSLQQLGRAIPTGVFDSAPIGHALSELFDRPGRTDDFRRLKRRLFVVATDLDSGESVVFGAKGRDSVPISKAVQASTALPGLFPPMRIDGHHYVDGALKKTLHASVALEHGAKLVLCINPLVPFDAKLAKAHRLNHRKLVEGGLPVVLSQMFRALIHSRLQVGMSKYDTAYRDADVLLFEPNPDDAEMFFVNVFSHANRRRVCAHAYQRTLGEIARRRELLTPILARHGIAIREDVLRRKHPQIGTSRSLRLISDSNLKGKLHSTLLHLDSWLRTRAAHAG